MTLPDYSIFKWELSRPLSATENVFSALWVYNFTHNPVETIATLALCTVNQLTRSYGFVDRWPSRIIETALLTTLFSIDQPILAIGSLALWKISGFCCSAYRLANDKSVEYHNGYTSKGKRKIALGKKEAGMREKWFNANKSRINHKLTPLRQTIDMNIHGSTACDMADPNSDLDIVITVYGDGQTTDKAIALAQDAVQNTAPFTVNVNNFQDSEW